MIFLNLLLINYSHTIEEGFSSHFKQFSIYFLSIAGRLTFKVGVTNPLSTVHGSLTKTIVDIFLYDSSPELIFFKSSVNNFSNSELYTAFLGITPSGSLFPFPEITENLPVPTGQEYSNLFISSSQFKFSLHVETLKQ